MVLYAEFRDCLYSLEIKEYGRNLSRYADTHCVKDGMLSVASKVGMSVRRHQHYLGRVNKILNKSSQSESGEKKMDLRYISQKIDKIG